MRYSYNTYKQMIVDSLKQELGAENVRETEVVKNNGVKREGVLLESKMKNISPIIYFDDIKSIYSDEEIEDFVRTAVKEYQEAQQFKGDGLKELSKWERVKNLVQPRLINFKENEEKLKRAHLAYVRVLDLAVTFLVPTSSIMPECGNGMINVKDAVLKVWGVNVETLYDQAVNNLENSQYSLKNMFELFGMLGMNDGAKGEKNEDTELLHMLTSYDGLGGAAVMLSKKILLESCHKMKCTKVFILPSSIHELLLIDSKKNSVSTLQEMVRDVNANVLEKVDFLSNEVYVFDSENCELRIAKDEDSAEPTRTGDLGNVA